MASEGPFLTFWSATAGRLVGTFEGPFARFSGLVAVASGGRFLTAGGGTTPCATLVNRNLSGHGQEEAMKSSSPFNARPFLI